MKIIFSTFVLPFYRKKVGATKTIDNVLFKFTMNTRNGSLLVLLCMVFGLSGQNMPVALPFFEDALRRAQLSGQLDPNISFCLRPIDVPRAAKIVDPFGDYPSLLPGDSAEQKAGNALAWRYRVRLDSFRLDPFKLKVDRRKLGWEERANVSFRLLPLYSQMRFNQHHPYGWSDGAMVPAKGFQQFFSFGAYAKVGFLELQLRPEVVWAENRPFQNPPARTARIDMPERMGNGPYQALFLGQSYLKAHLGPIAVGLSNENIWWGPGRRNAIIMSNNAPGFLHASLHTNRPIDLGIGTVEGQWVGGHLRRSGFVYPRRSQGGWPPIAGEIIPDEANGSSVYGHFSGITGVWQPKWTPGWFIGGIALSQVAGEVPSLYQALYTGFQAASRSNNITAGSAQNGKVALFSRYLFKEAHAEIYAEIGKQDWWRDFEDFWVRTDHATAYLVGFRKMHALAKPNSWLEIDAELTRITMPMGNILGLAARGFSFYQHGNGFGWTHRGQVLGAGIGPGSNMQSIGLAYSKGFRRIGLQFERVSHNEDLFFTGLDFLQTGDGSNPFKVDFTKKFVDLGFILSYDYRWGPLHYGLRTHFLRTFNFQYVYDPSGIPDGFRWPGLNVWSLNAELSLIYRL